MSPVSLLAATYKYWLGPSVSSCGSLEANELQNSDPCADCARFFRSHHCRPKHHKIRIRITMMTTISSRSSSASRCLLIVLTVACCLLESSLALQQIPTSCNSRRQSICTSNPISKRTTITSSTRRALLLSSCFSLPLLIPLVAKADADEVSIIQSLPTGVEYRDDRIGQGPVLPKDSTVVLHVRAMRRDGKVLFDTREDGQPLLHQLGGVIDYNFFGGKSGERSKMTVGLDDAIRTRNNGDMMREGGIRRVIVPGPLAYGHAGVSRYDAYQMGLREAVPRDEMIRYEVEVLRCRDVGFEVDGATVTRQACCTEPNYPCATPSEEEEKN